MNTIVVPLTECQKVRKILQDADLLDQKRKIRKQESFAYVPILEADYDKFEIIRNYAVFKIAQFKNESIANVNIASPYKIMIKELQELLSTEGNWNEELIFDIPHKWEKYGDLILLPMQSFLNPVWNSGNNSERHRLANLNLQNEIIVDLFAGIGYFTLPYLVGALAKHVHACEWNPHAVYSLRLNLKDNKVENRCTVYEGDCRKVCPVGIADRVNLGHIPSSEFAWYTGCKALKPEGGILVIHGNVDSHALCKEMSWNIWKELTVTRIHDILFSLKSKSWTVLPLQLIKIKSYAPHVDHLVLEIKCFPS